MRFPTIHGENVVFTYAGDLWVAKRGGGIARRLTSHPGLETRARISEDGKTIAFTGEYDGNQDVYTMPMVGGEPKRLTFEPDTDEVIGWSPDGQVMYTSTFGFFSGKQRSLYLADPDGGVPRRTVVRDISEGDISNDGSTIVYTRGRSHLFNWRRYRGGTQGRVSLYNFRTNAYSELPSGREQSYFPMFVGQSIYYISDKRQGTHNLYRYDQNTKKETQLTKFSDADIRFPSTDGKTIVYERDGYLYAYDIEGGNTQRLNPEIRSDFPVVRPSLRKLGDQVSSISVSPSGVRVAVEARGELFSVPAKTGETRNLTGTDGVRERFPRWSPNGQTIAYVGDATGEKEIYTRPQLGGEATQLTNAKLPISSIEWSPDGKRLMVLTEANEMYLLDTATKALTKVFKARFGIGGYDFSGDGRYLAYIDQEANTFGAVHVFDTTTNRSRRITDGRYDDSDVAFDLNGKYLYIVSARTFSPSFGQFEFSLKVDNAQRIYVLPLTNDANNPTVAPGDEEPDPASGATPRPTPTPPQAGEPKSAAPITIEGDDLGSRLIPLPMPAGSYGGLLGVNNGVLYRSGGTLSRFDLTSRESTTIGQGLVGPISFNQARTKMAYLAPGGLAVADVRPGLQPGQGRVDLSAVEAVIDPRKEWKQIFWEAWRYERDNFYDPQMRGLNWRAIGERYAQYLPYVAHRSDLDYVLGLMLGELGTGHSYVQSGDPGVSVTRVPVGQLGVDYEVSGEHIRLAKIYRGANFEESRRGPLGEPGLNVKEGDYLLAIDGQPVNRGVNPNSLLTNKVGRTVVLTVNSTPSMEGARKVRVRPIGNEANLRYAEFIEDNRRKVEQLSGGRIGYFHVPDTQFTGATEFIRGFYSQTDKDALLVDERWNNGGLVQPWFVDTLARRVKARVQDRNRADWVDAVAVEGPKAMLINGYAGSGGDFFPYMFRQAGLGPLIGTRTWGGLVGITGYSQFVDGGGVSAPEFALYDPNTNEIIAENTGIDPDIEVDNRPDLIAKGRDPQLEAGVAYLMEQLKKVKPRNPRTTVPQLGKKGRIE
jgi:tricorn protease